MTARGVAVSAAAFRLFPVNPLMGRTLLEEDEQPGAAPVAIIGHDLWRMRFPRRQLLSPCGRSNCRRAPRFDGDPQIVGKTVRLGTAVHTIAGVMPEGFGFPVNQNLWVPLKVRAAGLRRGEGDAIQIFGRLKAGVSADAARAELSGMLAASGEGPAAAQALVVDVRPYLESMLSSETSSASIEQLLYSGNLLFVMLLAICGTNVATLVFARTRRARPRSNALVSFTLARRTREIGIRVALGAAPRRIIGVLVGTLPSAAILVLGAEDSGGMKGTGLAVTVAVGAFVLAVAMISCAVPLRRALRIEPMQALRTDAWSGPTVSARWVSLSARLTQATDRAWSAQM